MEIIENGDELERKISDLRHLLGAIGISLKQGGNFLVGRLAPNGPIMSEPNLSYVYKAIWGMFASGVEREIIARLLDWTGKEALQPNGDFYFPGEGPEYKVLQRVYRPLTFLKVAAWMSHPLAKNELVLNRILQYQHGKSGGVFNYIGDNPNDPKEQATIGSLDTSFFGHLMVALDMRDHAIRAGDWIRRLVEANEENMLQRGFMFTQMTPDGNLVTDVKQGEKILKIVDNKDSKQEFWQVGTTMAYLCVLYDALRDRWGWREEQARPYLNCALKLLNFETSMPLYTYLWPSKCKVGWGAGELLKVLMKYERGTAEQVEKTYRVCEKVAVFTFMDNQLPNGGWSCMHYPLSDGIPEIRFSYKPLKGVVNVPDKPIQGSKTIFLPSEEITGEILGEMKAIEIGLVEYYRKLVNYPEGKT